MPIGEPPHDREDFAEPVADRVRTSTRRTTSAAARWRRRGKSSFKTQPFRRPDRLPHRAWPIRSRIETASERSSIVKRRADTIAYRTNLRSAVTRKRLSITST